MNVFSDISGALGGTQSWIETQWTQRLVQISVFSAVIFWFLSSYRLIEEVKGIVSKVFKINLGNQGGRVINAVIFGLFMYVIIRFVMDPLVKDMAHGGIVEGNESIEEDEDVGGDVEGVVEGEEGDVDGTV